MSRSKSPAPLTTERLLVFISSESADTNLVRSARRMAAQLNAEWFVVRVETAQNMILSPDQREKLAATLQLAEKLGAQIAVLQGQSVPDLIMEFARARNITKIAVGKPVHPGWKERIRGSLVDKIIQRNRDYDLYIIRSKAEPQKTKQVRAASINRDPRNYFVAIEILVIATLLAELLHTVLNPTNLIMIYVLTIVISAVFLGLGPSIFLSIIGTLTFDFLFIPPYYSLKTENIQSTLVLLTLLAVGIVISYLTERFRQQTEAAWQRERQTEALYALSRDMSVSNDLESYIHAIIRRSKDTFGREAVLYLPEAQNNGKLKLHTENSDIISNENDDAAALWAFEHRKIIGPGTDTLPNASASFLPLITARGIVGVLALFGKGQRHELSMEQERLMEAYADLAAVSLEGILLAKESLDIEILKGTEKLQAAFLNAISHDLRTPLVSVIGAISSLQEEKADLDDNARDQLIRVARDEAEKLNHLITNLLDESRIEAGAIKISRQPSDLQDLIGSALEQLGARSNSHPIKIDLPPDLPFVSADSALIIQTLVNILDNALTYSPADSPIEIKARLLQNQVEVEIADRGVGIPAQDLSRVFEKFYRVQQPENISGTGLVLSILIVDDEQSIRRFLRVSLEAQKYAIIEASTGQEALAKVVSEKPDIVVLDLGLPDMDGVEITRLVRQWTQVPIIILSVRNSEKDKIAALDAGADDYLTKPFGVGELLACLRVASRRLSQTGNEPVFVCDNLKVDLSRRLVTIDDRNIQLTPTEYDILKVLVVNAGKVLTHQQLLREVWGAEYADELHILHVNISNLRRKIEPDPSRPHFIITEPGVGYRLKRE